MARRRERHTMTRCSQLSLLLMTFAMPARLISAQYMKDKLTKWGIKLFMLAESSNGYTINFNVYTWANHTQPVSMDCNMMLSWTSISRHLSGLDTIFI